MACLHPISRMNGWSLTKLVHLYCVWHRKELSRFWWPWPIFKVTQGLRLLENGLSAPYLMKEWMDFDQTCTAILLRHKKMNRLDFADLDPFLRSHRGSDCWKIAFLHPISRMNGWILIKLVQLYYWERDNNWLDFGDLDPFLRSHKGLDFGKWLRQPHTHTHIHTKRNYRYNLLLQ